MAQIKYDPIIDALDFPGIKEAAEFMDIATDSFIRIPNPGMVASAVMTLLDTWVETHKRQEETEPVILEALKICIEQHDLTKMLAGPIVPEEAKYGMQKS